MPHGCTQEEAAKGTANGEERPADAKDSQPDQIKDVWWYRLGHPTTHTEMQNPRQRSVPRAETHRGHYRALRHNTGSLRHAAHTGWQNVCPETQERTSVDAQLEFSTILQVNTCRATSLALGHTQEKNVWRASQSRHTQTVRLMLDTEQPALVLLFPELSHLTTASSHPGILIGNCGPLYPHTLTVRETVHSYTAVPGPY